MADLAELEVRINTSGAAKARNAMGHFVKAGAAAEDQAKRTGKAWRITGKSAFTLAGAVASAKKNILELGIAFSAAAAARAAVMVYADFELTMKTLQGTLGTTEEAMADLTKQAKVLGATTKFSASQAGQAQLELARAGSSQADVLKQLPPILDLAAGAQLNLARASEIAGTTLNQFGLVAGDTKRVADVLVKGANSSAISVEQLAQSLENVGGIASVLGLSVEQSVAALGALSKAGLKGGKAGTGLGAVFRQLLSDVPAVTGALANLAKTSGQNADAFDITKRSLLEVVQNLAKAKPEAKELFRIFGSEGITSAQALISQVEALESIEKGTLNAEDAAKKLAAIMSDTLTGSFLSLKSAIEGAFIQLGESGLGDGLKELVQFVTQVIRALSGMEDQIEGNKELVLLFANAVRGAAAALATIIALRMVSTLVTMAKAFKGVTLAVRGLTAAIAANPIGAIAVAVGLLVFALFQLKDEFVDIGGTSVRIGNIMQATWEATVKVLTELWESFSEIAIEAWDAVSDFFVGALDVYISAFKGTTDDLGSTWQNTWRDALLVIRKWANRAIGIIASMVSIYVSAFKRIGKVASAAFELDPRDPVASALRLKDAIADVLDFETIVSEAGDTFAENWDRDFISEAGVLMQEAGSFLSDKFSAGFSSILDRAKELQALEDVAKDAQDAADAASKKTKTTSKDNKEIRELSDTIKDARKRLKELRAELIFAKQLVGVTAEEAERLELVREVTALARASLGIPEGRILTEKEAVRVKEMVSVYEAFLKDLQNARAFQQLKEDAKDATDSIIAGAKSTGRAIQLAFVGDHLRILIETQDQYKQDLIAVNKLLAEQTKLQNLTDCKHYPRDRPAARER